MTPIEAANRIAKAATANRRCGSVDFHKTLTHEIAQAIKTAVKEAKNEVGEAMKTASDIMNEVIDVLGPCPQNIRLLRKIWEAHRLKWLAERIVSLESELSTLQALQEQFGAQR